MFSGSYVAIVTPFHNGKIDEESYANLIERQAEAKTDGIVPCGTTGESPTLSHAEHEHLIALTVRLVNKRMKVLAGTGSNNTAEAIRLSRSAEECGADGCLVINPYYNKPMQSGLFEHFAAIANSIHIPMIVYNIASRTAVNVTTPTMVRLSKIKNIVGVKEASGDLSQMTDVSVSCGPNFSILSGDDSLTLPLLSIGGHGVISVVGNLIPADLKDLIDSFRTGNMARAQELNRKMFPLIKALFSETNPIPVKTALSMMGLIKPEIRLPLTQMESMNAENLRKVMREYGLKV